MADRIAESRPRSPRAALRAAAALAALALCQCSTSSTVGAAGSSMLQPTDRVEAVYRADGLVLAMCNEAAAQAGTVASQNLKVARHGDLELLLGGWRDCGFFEAAAIAPTPGAKAVLLLRLNGAELVRSRMPLRGDNAGDISEFNQCLGLFRQLYNGTQAFTASSTIDREHFERQNEIIRRRAEAAMRRAQGGR